MSNRARLSATDVALLVSAVLAFLWAVARAHVQAITIDEADTYLVWVARTPPFHWEPASNNHVLNSALMRLFTSVFGTWHLTVRAPALIGAALYIGAAYCLCKLLCETRLKPGWTAWALFICLVCNPFIFDYLVAARGYGMASAFLLWAIVVPAYRLRSQPVEQRLGFVTCAVSSVCAAFSVSSNFSFAIATVVALTGIALWMWMRTERTVLHGVRIVLASVIPGLIVASLIALPTAVRMPARELWYGAINTPQMFRSLVDSSLYRVNENLANPLVRQVAEYLKPWLLRVAGWLALLRVIVHVIDRLRRSDSDPIQSRWITDLAALSAATAIGAGLVHYIAFRTIDMKLPLERTGIFFVVLLTVAAGALACLPADSRASAFTGRGLQISVFATAIYFLLCLRLTYFREWYWDAEVKNAWHVAEYYARQMHADTVVASFYYGSPMNFYRVTSQPGHDIRIINVTELPTGYRLYVVNGLFDRPFIEREKLRILWQGDWTEVTIAVKENACP